MSPTPIYDALRETRPDERTADSAVCAQTTIRLVVPQFEAGNVSELHTRHGVGGRHRRTA